MWCGQCAEKVQGCRANGQALVSFSVEQNVGSNSKVDVTVGVTPSAGGDDGQPNSEHEHHWINGCRPFWPHRSPWPWTGSGPKRSGRPTLPCRRPAGLWQARSGSPTARRDHGYPVGPVVSTLSAHHPPPRKAISLSFRYASATAAGSPLNLTITRGTSNRNAL